MPITDKISSLLNGYIVTDSGLAVKGGKAGYFFCDSHASIFSQSDIKGYFVIRKMLIFT